VRITPSDRSRATTAPTSAGCADTPAPPSTTNASFTASFPGTADATIIGRPAVIVSVTVSPPALPTTTSASEMRAGMSFSNPRMRARTPAGASIFFALPHTTVSSMPGMSANDWTIRSIGPTPKPPLVTRTESRPSRRGSTGAMCSNAARTGIPVTSTASSSTPCATISRAVVSVGTAHASTPRSAQQACAM